MCNKNQFFVGVSRKITQLLNIFCYKLQPMSSSQETGTKNRWQLTIGVLQVKIGFPTQ